MIHTAEKAPQTATQGDVFTLLQDVIARLDRVERLLLAESNIRDRADDQLGVGLLDLMADAGGTFRAADMVTRGELSPAFGALLEAADVVTVADAGYWLRRNRGRFFDGRRIDVVGRDGEGAIWGFVTI